MRKFLPFISNKSEPKQIYSKLCKEFPEDDIVAPFYSIMEYGFSAVRAIVEEMPSSASKTEIIAKISSVFSVSIDYVVKQQFYNVIKLCDHSVFSLYPNIPKEQLSGFIYCMYATGNDDKIVIENLDLKLLLSPQDVLNNINKYISLVDDDDENSKNSATCITVSSKNELGSYILQLACTKETSVICFKLVQL